MTTLVDHTDMVEDIDPAFDFKAISGQIGIDKAQGCCLSLFHVGELGNPFQSSGFSRLAFDQ